MLFVVYPNNFKQTNMTSFGNLSPQDKDAILKYPSYISLLAANSDGTIDEKEKKSAIKLSHIKTYSCDPVLSEFYAEVDKVFEMNIKSLDNELPKIKEERDEAIKNELQRIEKILLNFNKDYAATMRRSMKSFKDHVSKAHHNVLEYLIFPVAFKEIRD